MGIDKKISKKFLRALAELFGEVFEHIVELGLWGYLVNLYFGLTLKTAIALAIMITILSVCKKIYYRDDFYLAFAIMLIFHDNIILSWFVFVYISYFRGIYGFYYEELRESKKFNIFKSKIIGFIGQYLAPFIIIYFANKYKKFRDEILFLVWLAFSHHLNYYGALFIDMILNRNKYRIKEIKRLFYQCLRDTKLNLIITIIFFIFLKGIVFRFVYSEDWGIIDDISKILSWII